MDIALQKLWQSLNDFRNFLEILLLKYSSKYLVKRFLFLIFIWLLLTKKWSNHTENIHIYSLFHTVVVSLICMVMWSCCQICSLRWDIIVNTDDISLWTVRCSWVCYEGSYCQMFQHYPTFKNSLSIFRQQFQKEFSFCFSKYVTHWNQWYVNCKQVAVWRVSEVMKGKQNQGKFS